MESLKGLLTEEQAREIHCCGCRSNVIAKCECDAFFNAKEEWKEKGYIKENHEDTTELKLDSSKVSGKDSILNEIETILFKGNMTMICESDGRYRIEKKENPVEKAKDILRAGILPGQFFSESQLKYMINSFEKAIEYLEKKVGDQSNEDEEGRYKFEKENPVEKANKLMEHISKSLENDNFHKLTFREMNVLEVLSNAIKYLEKKVEDLSNNIFMGGNK